MESLEDDQPFIVQDDEDKEGLEIEITRDLKDIPEKLDTFQLIVLGLTKQVAELKNQKLKVPAGLLALPGQVFFITAQLSKLKVLDA
ncbi:hypothetical protein Tco_0187518 [Tanacetum coccineum]